MHLFTYEDLIIGICGHPEYEGLYDQITANYEGYVDDKITEILTN